MKFNTVGELSTEYISKCHKFTNQLCNKVIANFSAITFKIKMFAIASSE
jgi:hypothetical protein